VNDADSIPSDSKLRQGPVFISYASSDRRKALSICKAIERRGIDCWISARDVQPGENYQEAIVRAIRSARALVLVFSEAANNSDEIKKELSLASKHRLPVFALRVADVEPSDAFAYELSTRQWIDAFTRQDKAIGVLASRLTQASGLAGNPPAKSVRVTGLSPFAGLRTRAVAASVIALLFVAALAGWQLLLRPADTVMLAVVPFRDLSPTHDKAYFAEGVAEEILSTLAAEKGIRVLGRTSAGQIERDPNPEAIRASLGVTHLLEGSARTAGDSLRVNVRLIDTADGSQMWAEEYRGSVADTFKVQDEIASGVVERLRGTLFRGEIKSAPTTSIDAYQGYLAARALIRQNKSEAIARAWKTARDIVRAHPDYAPAHALLAETSILLSDGVYGYGRIPVEKARRVALRHAKEAIRLAPQRAEGYAAVGLALPVANSIEPYRKALSLDPSRTDVRLRLAIAYDVLKRTDEAFQEYRTAAETDPLSPAIINRYIQILGSSGRTDEAMRAVEQFVQRTGLKAQGWRFRGAVYAYRGDFSKAVAARKRALQLEPGLPYQRDWLLMYLHLLGLDDLPAPFRDGTPDYVRSFVEDDRDALKRNIVEQGISAWQTSGVEFALFSLGRSRDWSAIATLYDKRPSESDEQCARYPGLSPLIAMALAKGNRRRDAAQFANCAQRQISALLKMRYRSPDEAPGELEASQAGLLALRDDPLALDWLDKAVSRGWVGQYFSSQLADWPQFESFRGDPRYAAIQRRIDSTIARERQEVLAGR